MVQFTKVEPIDGPLSKRLLAVVYKYGVNDSTKNDVPKDTMKIF